MTDSLKLDQAVGLLTRESKHVLKDSEGKNRWVTADPLLVQLRMAVTHSTAPATFKASAGTPIPLSVVAYDLLAEISEVTLEHWWELYNQHHGQGRESLVGQLRAWAMAAHARAVDLVVAEKVICGWVSQIQGLLQPTRHREIKGICPACLQQKIVVRMDDEGIVRAPALSILYDLEDNITGAQCAACGAHWSGDPLMELAREIAAQ